MNALVEVIAQNASIHKNGPWMIPEPAVLPSGAESGSVLVIGVGGSTLRLTRVEVNNKAADSVELFSCLIPSEIKADQNFFHWAASKILPELDIATIGIDNPMLALSWSFPLVDGKIDSMGKKFCNHFDKMDLLTVFNSALGSKYRIVTATHDGTSSLISGAYHSKRCRMALTLGTGVNINLITGNDVFVNSEISMLGRPDLEPKVKLKTQFYDFKNDPAALFQPFEAQIGGLWLERMASIALGEDISMKEFWSILEQRDADSKQFSLIHEIVSRAASLVAAAIYGLQMAFTKENNKDIEVAYTGGVIFEPVFRAYLENELAILAKDYGFKVCLNPQRQGSEVGCAISALTAVTHPQAKSAA